MARRGKQEETEYEEYDEEVEVTATEYGSEEETDGKQNAMMKILSLMNNGIDGYDTRKKEGVKNLEAAAKARQKFIEQNEQTSRKNYPKLEYQGYQEKDLPCSNQVFQALWQVQTNEDQFFLKKTKDYAQLRILDRPKRRLDAMIDLRMEILQMCDAFYGAVKRVTDRIMNEVHDPELDAGLLELDIDRYMGCLTFDLVGLDNLLSDEVVNRRAELQLAEKQSQ